ncbi:MAG: bifunctional DNA-formamidopyrimidine glycosylase/DNA-(apurinic or apyrimidinic site) lyase [Thermoanaerobaculia bacterium]
MPELPEIEVLRRSLEPRLVGRRIERVEVRAKALRERLDRRALGALAGRRIEALERRSKYLLVGIEGGERLAIHLGMSGRLTLVPGPEPREPHEHLAFHLDRGERLRLRDPRRFGAAFIVARAGLEADPHFVHLGIEPLSPALDGHTLAELARGRRAPAKAFLMDGRRVVGVGNIYATEALFRAGIDPRRSVARLTGERFARLAAAVVEVLEEAIVAGGTTLNDFTDGSGQQGEFQIDLAVYGRAGQPCPRCGRAVRRIVQSGRSSFFCPRCQR